MAASDIQTEADEPKAIFADGVRVEEHSIKDKIEADKYVGSTADGIKKNRGIGFTQFRGQGAVR